MTIFEYVSVMASIILALGVARLLTGVATRLVAERAPRTYWVHYSWLVTLGLLHIQVWWALWFRYNVPALHFSQFAYILAVPATLFIAAFVLLPGSFPQDAESHFYRVRRPFFAVVFLGALSAAIGPFFHARAIPFRMLDIPTILRVVEIAALGLPVLGFLSSDRRVHAVLAVAYLSFAILSFFVPQFPEGR